MIGATALLALLVVWPSPQPPARRATAEPPAATQVVVVNMVDKGGGKWAFEPSAIQAQPGDTVRFVQADVVPHNVQFKSVPKGASLGAAMMGPFLVKKGDTYDLVIDARFVTGTYHFVCTPHEMMGMKGTLEVSGGTRPDGAPTRAHARTPSGGIQ